MSRLQCFIIFLSLLFLPSCNSCNQVNPELAKTKARTGEQVEERKVLYIFVNPNGEPCKKQIAIVDKIQDQIKKHASLLYLKTTEPFDRQSFYDYGIRSLPMLIFVDKKGVVLHRFPPGIQSAKRILSLFEGN